MVSLMFMFHLFFQIPTSSCTRLSELIGLDWIGLVSGHSLKLVKSHYHFDSRKQLFSVRVVNRWNSLTQEMMTHSETTISRGI